MRKICQAKKTKYHVITDIHAMQYMFDCKKNACGCQYKNIHNDVGNIHNDVGSREFPL